MRGLAFIPYFLLAFLWTLRLFPDKGRWASVAASLPLCLALLLAGTAIPGRWLQELSLPFYVSSGICLGLSGLLILRRGFPLSGWRPPLRRADWPWLLALALATALVAIVTVRYSIFDEVRLQGHIPVVEAMLRGRFPPAYIAFPDVDFRYHYGFNVLAALASLAFGAKGYVGIDALTIFCWAAFAVNLLLLFSRLGIARGGWALAFCFTVLSGGMSWLLVAKHDGGTGMLFQLPNWQQMFIFGRVIHPSFIMYFFQHPISLGLLFFLGMLACFQRWAETGERRAYWTGVFLLGAMSLAQVMLFATSLAALGVVFAVRFFRPEIPKARNCLAGLGVLLGALALALALGGFFQWSPGAESQPLRFTWPPGYLRNEFYARGRPIAWWQGLTWYFSGFGLALFWIPLAWWRALRATRIFPVLFLLAFGAISAAIPHFFQYAFSWDIVKWFFAFEFSGRILAAWAFWPWVARGAARQALAWALVLFGMVTPLRFLGELAFRSGASFTRAELRVAGYRRPEWRGAFAALTQRMIAAPENYGMVWGSSSTSVSLAMATGFPMAQLDFNTVAMPVGRQRIADRQAVLKTLAENPSRPLLQELGLRWIVFSCAEAKGLSPAAKRLLQELEADPGVEKFTHSEGPRDCFQAYRLR